MYWPFFAICVKFKNRRGKISNHIKGKWPRHTRSMPLTESCYLENSMSQQKCLSLSEKDAFIPANWRSRSVIGCFTSARNIMLEHKIKLCLHYTHGMFSLCLAVFYLWSIGVHIGFVCVYFEFTLSSSTWWTQNGFKSAHREHKKILNTH